MSRANHADAWAWSQECSRRAGAAGIGFRWDATVEAPCTDGKTVTIPPLPKNATHDDFVMLRGAVVHECGHIVRPRAFEILKAEAIKQGSPLWACFNIVEDAAQERATADRWLGDRLALSEAHAAITRKQAARAAKDLREGKANSPSPDAHKFIAAMATSLISGADWSIDMHSCATDYVRAMDSVLPGTAQLTADLLREGWAKRIAEAGDVDGAYQVARELRARLFPEQSEEESKQAPQDGKGKGEEGEGKGKGKPGEPGKGEAEGEPEPEDFRVVPWELVFHSDHAGELGVASPMSIDWTGKTRDKGPVYFQNQEVSDVDPSRGAMRAAKDLKFPAPLVQEVRRLLQSRARVRWDHEKLEGRLDRRNLTRILMPRVGDGTFNRTVFQKKVPKLTLDCAVTVLVDSSGSMSGQKFHNAAAAAMALYDLAQVALKVPCEVLGFSTSQYQNQPRYFLFKEFSERRIDRTTLAAKLMELEESGCLQGNADGDALLWAGNRLRKRRESRRILIVLSDGCPADSVNGDPYTNLCCAVESLRRLPNMEVYGIGIEDTNVRKFYSKSAPVIQNANEVGAALIEVLRDVLQKQGAAS